MQKMKRLLVLILITCAFVFALVGCDSLLEQYGQLEGIAPHEHTLVEHKGKAPTCTEGGWDTYYTCSGCEDYTTYKARDPLGHNFGESYVPNGEVHSLFCGRCSLTKDEAHNWVAGDIAVSPTCMEAGEQTYVCSGCNAAKTMPISALGHSYSEKAKPNGDTHSFVCIRCPESIDQNHEWKKSENSIAPTCTDNGTDIYICLVCNARRTEDTELLGHDFSGVCLPDKDGHTTSCIRCTVTVSGSHVWLYDTITISPTCLDRGEEKYICELCNAYKTEKLSALGHDYSKTATENGDIHSFICSHCSDSIDQPHEWEMADLLDPTCNNDGIKLYKCSACDAQKSEILPALGHDFSDEYHPNGDVHSLVCSRCTDTVDEDHKWQTGEYRAPNCANKGYQQYVCSVCSQEHYDYIPTVDEHYEGEWKIAVPVTALNDGLKVLPCSVCGISLDEQILSAEVNMMPIIYLEGDYLSATAAKNEVEMSFSYVEPGDGLSFDGYATIKVQGATSVNYAKKNYTIKFYKDETFDKKLKVDLGWGKESKYVMKANWVDFIQARNVVSCRLWGDMVLTRNETETQKRLAALSTNGGAIDGYPIAVFMNGEFHGIYTMNVPKDEWMFGMDDSETEAFMGADDWNHTNFSSLIGYFEEDEAGDLITAGWELKYCGSDDVTWVTDSFNELIQFCWNNEGEAFKAGISEHLDVDAAIDYLIYMYVVYMRDNSSKNMLWATYDGKIWIPSVYDQDGVFGQVWDGKRYAGASETLPKVNPDGSIDVGVKFGPQTGYQYEGKNFILWDRIWNAFTEEILIRYKELRETVLSEENIIAEFEAFRACIPESVYEAEIERWEVNRNEWWTGTAGVWYEKFNYEYTYEWIGSRLEYMDDAMRNIYYNSYLPNAEAPAF